MKEYATHQQPFIIEMEVGGGRILKLNFRQQAYLHAKTKHKGRKRIFKFKLQ